MKRIIGILALLCACTQSVDVRAEEFTKEEVCAVWAGNATLGGSQALRGKARKLIPLQEGQIIEILEHGKLFDLDGIVVWADDYAAEPEFVEGSVFFGYDYVMRMKEAGAEATLPASAKDAHELFFRACMAMEDA